MPSPDAIAERYALCVCTHPSHAEACDHFDRFHRSGGVNVQDLPDDERAAYELARERYAESCMRWTGNPVGRRRAKSKLNRKLMRLGPAHAQTAPRHAQPRERNDRRAARRSSARSGDSGDDDPAEADEAPPAAREAVARVWTQILRERHPGIAWEIQR